ncbi:MAG: CDP-glycerol glycerophosphotransferase family protein [Clostridiales bacterium]|nr:CDP-glycerol glycerophosphotransferase family protein [Candidatus Crickella equi]
MELAKCDITNKGKNEQLLSFEIAGTTMKVTALCKETGRNYVGIVLAFKHKAEVDKQAYSIPTEVRKTGKDIRLLAEVDLSKLAFRMTNWQILAAYEEDGKLYGVGLKAPNSSKDIYQRFVDNYSCDLGDYILFPYYTRKGTINFRYRPRNEYDGNEIHEREKIADKNSKKLFGNKLAKQDIALIYEKKCTSAQDNGYYLFKYCMEAGVNETGKRKVYYVVDKRTPAYQKIKEYDKYVLDFMSLEHMEHLKAAKVLISSESRLHAYAWHSKNSIIAPCVQDKKHVFLGHGILALKKLNNTFTAESMASSLVTVSSEREADVFKEYLNYDDKALSITGYARFDALEDKSSEYNEILVMPTHRERLFGVEREVFVASEYYKRYMDLLNSERLHSILEKNDMKLKFYLHPSIREQIDAYSSNSDRVEIIKYGEMPLDELMMRCKLLITDYSSILWDVLYMKKPAIFYQYDRDEYEQSWGSYIDLDKDLPGDNAVDLDSLLDNLEKSVANNFVLEEKYNGMLDNFYKYTDRDNCKRIWEEICKLY